MVAAAAVLSREGTGRARVATPAEWQNKAWTYYDEVGELRFGVSWLANALSRVNLVAAVPPKNQGDEPTAIDLTKLPAFSQHVGIVAEIGGGVAGQGQIMAGSAKQLTVAGIGYLFVQADPVSDTFASWRVVSTDEVRRQGDRIEVRDPESGDWVEMAESDLLVKMWRPHPRRSWEPDSPVRAVLGVLAEIKRMSQRVIADAESRLAGNGILVLPTEVEFPAGQAVRSTDDDDPKTDEDDGDDFAETLTDVAQMAMEDQGTAAARVPLVIRVPGEYVDKVQHLTFWTDFDSNLDTLRQAAVRRLALGLDMPPEVLLGMGDTNHWSAWQIAEEAITLQIEPLAELVCHALTIGYLRPALQAAGLDPDSCIVWYDTTDLTTRPDRSTVAAEAHSRLKLSDAAYLRELGLDVADMPSLDELRIRVLMDVAKGAPTLAPFMLAAAGLLDPAVADAAAAEAPTDAGGAPSTDQQQAPETRTMPDRQETPPPAEGQQNSMAMLAAADLLVVRALELAGRRLRGAAGKGRPGGAESIPCDDPCLLHTQVAATEHASLEALLASAWDRVPPVAARLGVDPQAMVAWLDTYTRSLIAAGHAHDYDRLASSLEVAHVPALAAV